MPSRLISGLVPEVAVPITNERGVSVTIDSDLPMGRYISSGSEDESAAINDIFEASLPTRAQYLLSRETSSNGETTKTML
jgi:hypothetical protein